MTKIVRVLRPGSTRDVSLFETRDKAKGEKEAAFKKYQEQLEEWKDVVIVTKMIKRPEYVSYALEIERLRAELDAKLKADKRDVNDVLMVELEQHYLGYYKTVFDGCVETIKGINFQDDITGEIVESTSLEKKELFELISQCGLLHEVALAALRGNRLSSDQKKISD